MVKKKEKKVRRLFVTYFLFWSAYEVKFVKKRTSVSKAAGHHPGGSNVMVFNMLSGGDQ